MNGRDEPHGDDPRPLTGSDQEAPPERLSVPGAQDPEPGPRMARGGGQSLRFGLAFLGVAVLVAIIAVVIAGTSDGRSEDVERIVAAEAESVPGPLPPDELRSMRCESDDAADDRYRCRTTVDDPVARAPIVVEYRPGEDLTRRLAGSAIDAPPRAGQDVAELLAADELALTGRRVTYGCGFSTGLSPGGGTDAAGPGGFRCATTEAVGASGPQQRYVQFTSDGSVSRDFLLR